MAVNSSRPPASKTVVLTRSHEDNHALAVALTAAGLEVLEVPTAEIGACQPTQGLEAIWQALREVQAVTFTSRHGVWAWVEHGGDAALRAFASRGGAIGVVGPATSAALVDLGHVPTVTAAPATGEALAAQLAAYLLPASGAVPAKVLAVQARRARPELVDGLRSVGVAVEIAAIYDNRVPAGPDTATLLACHSAGAIYVAAPSAAERLLAWDPDLRGRPFVAIGPTTAAALRERHGIEARGVAQDPSQEAVVRAIVDALAALG